MNPENRLGMMAVLGRGGGIVAAGGLVIDCSETGLVCAVATGVAGCASTASVENTTIVVIKITLNSFFI